MAIQAHAREEIRQILTQSLRKKFQNYNPEPGVMPFHTRLLGEDRLALYSFIHSLNTNFGTSIFEPVAVSLAGSQFISAEKQQKSGTQISSEAHNAIQRIMDGLAVGDRLPNKPQEIEEIRSVCQSGEMVKVRPTRVDLKLVGTDGTTYLIDIKTAKPNAGEFKGYKRTMLEWVAASLAMDPSASVHSLIAIPYNPYAPKPYERWTIRGMLDLEHELKVAEGFWDFLAGPESYESLLGVFEQVGIDMRFEIDKYFAKFRNVSDNE
ncbi:MAG: TdeIII family type II restriction endonuclease [Candidatus Cloacimonetes bacterium]|nr:TdeIII family type II restriction endonuclease [Candidatus Cloacimonadota bacterium]